MFLRGNKVHLRALEPEDLSFLYEIENDELLWEVSHTQAPYSKWLLKNYLENSHQDIYEVKQLRLAIAENGSNHLIGLIDLYDFDPKNSRVGLGIVVKSSEERNKGFGSESVELLLGYAFHILNVHQIYVNVAATNHASIKLFSKFGFEKVGVKKQWNKIGAVYVDELLYQLINPLNEN
ncbi:GNAT family N-acetyltransferase [Flavobacterium sp. CBA20B-1]|uniref:GNAT family N-acetyltransferase n=1 Tax=Paenimyroides aestuarii TaxID=2968490 RepID=A0ABY5NTE3_9FLAO|nr:MULTISPECIES: GNAT family protein [Flavobacteriaceae]UUV21614.1 GNAT family N-acetyltransferase [Paenimyroides aestuarii]WCM43523.1 GNAT family N-acetyltransferase [Flavobacterium sp. CBA20B-1]